MEKTKTNKYTMELYGKIRTKNQLVLTIYGGIQNDSLQN